MKNIGKYRIGLDIGIGSVGWAVVSLEKPTQSASLEDCGVRIFDSGEHPKKSETLCSGRRQSRGVRRLERRRANRKKLMKNHFQNIGIIGNTFNDELAACKDADVYALKVKGLDEKLSAAELFKCLVHTCNHRGYKDFYEPDPNDPDAGKLESAANAFEKSFRDSKKRTVSEYLLAETSENGFVKFRNRDGGAGGFILVRRDLLRNEAKAILAKQAEYYPCLCGRNADAAIDIIFQQRDFEDGPGDPNDPMRRYKGFLESLGKCQFYKTEDRGFRGTVIADVYAVTNTLSQYRYVDNATGEYCLNRDIAAELVDHLLQNASLRIADVKRILKTHNYTLQTAAGAETNSLAKSIKFLSLAKSAVEKAGLDWTAMISEPQFDVDAPSLLHRIGELMSKFQTPSRRKSEMKTAGIDPKLIDAFSGKKLSGTASVSDRYMCDAINAFLEGDIYGNFQAAFQKAEEDSVPAQKTKKLLPSHIDDPDVRNNRVVFKSINETRKIVNAIIDQYGSPEEIVVEVASELGKSFEMRDEIKKRQREQEKAAEEDRKKIAELLNLETDTKVTGSMLERYRLFVEQNGVSVYSGKSLAENAPDGMAAVIRNVDHIYEVDHIIPYSLILDNTLDNKVLVFAAENQKKGQRAPLEYLQGTEQKEFKKCVNQMYVRKTNKISKKKLAYFLLPTLHGEQAEEILGQWKTRNINDTRYITKYICGILKQYLLFTGEKKQHVVSVKGAVTQRFRRDWFRDTDWGDVKKDRSTYLHHALDAVIAANLTRPYIEIGSDAMRLISMYKYHRGRYTPEYYKYLDDCVKKMAKYYGFRKEYTRELLSNAKRIPSYVPNIKDAVLDKFADNMIVSQKQDRKFHGEIADAKPVRIEEIDGKPHKMARISIAEVTASNLAFLRTDDPSLHELLKTILGEYDSVGKYMSANDLAVFRDAHGNTIRKVTLDKGVMTSYYRVQKAADNYANLNSPKYYCVDIYQDESGGTKIFGIRYVDLVKKNGKLYLKHDRLPKDYGKHVLYLFTNDFFRVFKRNGSLKAEGYYTGVANINEARIYCQRPNADKRDNPRITKSDIVSKYDVSLLGKIGGEIGGHNKCSEPFPFIPEKE